MARYQLLGLILKKLGDQRADIEKSLAARSPLEQYDDLEPNLREKLEGELEAAVESEYRRQRADVLGALHWWLRDVWLQTLHADGLSVCFPDLKAAAAAVAARISPAEAMRNLEQYRLFATPAPHQRPGGARFGSGPAQAEIGGAFPHENALPAPSPHHSTTPFSGY